MVLIPGNEVVLQCLGTTPGNPWLDGRTGDGTAGLASRTDGGFTGTRWRVYDGGNGSIMLECLGTTPGNRWLDGRTGDGTAGLAPRTDGGFTGTRWRVHDGGNGSIMLECLGTAPGNRWLDGRTDNDTVGLAPGTDGGFTGTRWFASFSLANFTFDSDISAENRDKLIERHRFAVSRIAACNTLTGEQRTALFAAYRRAIRHSTITTPGVNAQATIGGAQIWVNFEVLFPQKDIEIAQTLIHEMMHCAGFTHPNRRSTDVPFDNGPYYSTPPLQAEICIAGNQSDILLLVEEKASHEDCFEKDGVFTIRNSE
jgi:hypothetical protein